MKSVCFSLFFMKEAEMSIIETNLTELGNAEAISQNYHGRKVLYSAYTEITRENILDFLNDQLSDMVLNRAKTDYLYKYYKGDQPIKYKTKQTRPEINNRVTVNRANEIVSFKTGYFIGEPIQYVGRGDDPRISENISILNGFMGSENKASKDKELVEWQNICGTSYRMVLPDSRRNDEAPFELYTLDPRYAAVVYSTDFTHKPLAGIYATALDNGEYTYSIYTVDHFFEVRGSNASVSEVIKDEPHRLGMIPIFEYPANNARLGAFEIVMPLLDSINKVQSDRLDGIEQFINSLLVFYNCELGEDEDGNEVTPQMLREQGALFLQSIGDNKADLKEISSQLDQTNTQTLMDNMYQQVLTIVGMPSQSDGSTGDSSNNGAVIFKNGWQGAETRAKEQELSFIPPEREMLKLVIAICNAFGELNLAQSEIEIKFTRRQYDNLQVKAQVLSTLLGTGKVAPIDAFVVSGLFSDPELSCKRGLEWFEASQVQEQEPQQEEVTNEVEPVI